MANEIKEARDRRIEEIKAQITALSGELWDLVQPTKDEVVNLSEQYGDYDRDELVELLLTETKDAWATALLTSLDVLDYREAVAEETEEADRG